MAEATSDHTEDTLLGGHLRYFQRKDGFRTGIEPILLAACVPAKAGDTVLEAGTGAGAASLCLAARVPQARIVGIERDPNLAILAESNARRNRIESFSALAADVLRLPLLGTFDHAMSNPPWHDPESTASPVAGRDLAKRAPEGMLVAWIAALAARLRAGGTLSLILPAGQSMAALAALAASHCGACCVFPLWPREGREAKLLILRARRLRKGPSRILPGLILHAEQSRYTLQARHVLETVGDAPLF